MLPLSRARLNHSLKAHVETFGNVGAEAGTDGDAAANLAGLVVACPDRVAAGAKKRVGIGRLGFGGVKGVIGICIEYPRLLGAAAIALNVDYFLVVARQRQADLAPEIFRCRDVEEIGV